MLKRLLTSLKTAPSAPQPSPQPAPAQPHGSYDAGEPYIAYMALADKTMWVRPDGEYRSGLASVRLRTIIPARRIARDIRVAFVPLENLATGRGLEGLGRLHALVLGKLSTPDVVAHQGELETMLDWLEGAGARLPVCADLSDDYAGVGRDVGHPYLERYQRRLGERCELVVPCQALADRVAPWAKRGIRVIEDPWETPAAAAPRFAPGATLHMTWFGNLGLITLDWLERGLAAALAGARDRPVRLTLVTGEQRAGMVEQLRKALASMHPALETVFVPWSVEATLRAIADADLVLLPQDASSDWGRSKSHNRLVETLRGGRLAVATDIPSYREMRDYAWVGDDLGEGVRWALAHPEEARARIAAGQRYIEGRFAPEVVAAKWKAALGVAPAPAPVRLNLGCGDKILEGYVNVDVAASRAGKRPDVLCDLRRLEPFADHSVDEVLAVHVVEHFWRWEVLDVLKEWVRVLRPGGRMVLECPNLLTACEELLRNPEAAAGTGQEAQRTMWVFYGDPRWQDPLMTHRWNYTPASLAALMREAGLVNVRQEPAQFKLREPRDMRVVGEKPAAGSAADPD